MDFTSASPVVVVRRGGRHSTSRPTPRMTTTDRVAPGGDAGTANAPTKDARLRARIAELAALGRANDVDGFVAKFVPKDCEVEDVVEFTRSLREDGERWELLRSEIDAINAGAPRARLIAGDEMKRAEFRFEMPRRDGEDLVINREVAFVNYAEDGEPSDWRAEG
jgi:hypothetical protein